MRNRIKRIDREYGSLAAAISSLKARELSNYILVIGKINLFDCKLFDYCDWQFFLTKFKKLIIKVEVERKMRFCDFKKQLSDYIEKMVYEDYKDELMILVREAYGIKDDKELYEVAKRIFKKEKIEDEL